MDINGKKLEKNNFRLLVVIAALTVLILIILTSFIASYQYVVRAAANKDAELVVSIEAGKEIPVDIPLGSTTGDIAKILKENEVIKHPTLFKLLSNYEGFDGTYKSGTHVVSQGLEYYQLMQILSSNPVSIKVTIPEGYTYKKIVDEMVKKKLGDSGKFDEAMKSESYDFKFLEGLPQRDIKYEGYLFPDTYEFDLKVGEKEVIRAMLKNFDNKFKPEYYEQAKKLNMTVDNIIILASIIEKEAKLPQEKRVISGIFYNRLTGKYNSPRKLESCATLQYIYSSRGVNATEDTLNRVMKGIITNEDKSIKDPYNTYMYDGLPPGPICSPGKDSIEAALYPEDTQYKYFVARGDGTTQFSKTIEEQNAAIQKYGIKLSN